MGNTTISVDARGNPTYFGYDGFNRLEWQKDALENRTSRAAILNSDLV